MHRDHERGRGLREKETRGVEEGKREIARGKDGKRERWARRVERVRGR